MLMLGDVLALARRSAAALEALPPDLVAGIKSAAEAEGTSPARYLRGAVAAFAHEAAPDEWAQLMTRLRESDDPAGECLRTMVERRGLAHAPQVED
jgi:hypothetical protein